MQRRIRTRGHMGQNPRTACFTDLREILEYYTASAPVVFTSFLVVVVVFFIILAFASSRCGRKCCASNTWQTKFVASPGGSYPAVETQPPRGLRKGSRKDPPPPNGCCGSNRGANTVFVIMLCLMCVSLTE